MDKLKDENTKLEKEMASFDKFTNNI